MSARPVVGGAQPPEQLPINNSTLLIMFILIVVAFAAYRDPKLATAIGAACAVGALLVVVLIV
ncbi:hypothetical protein [Actinomadura litoris]|uniref:Uncharacterized protein n=1 Tax=Actinomadura litoris TaxID=2678616 RepID=A0A7K1LBR7_9ACTN|nr:hypothetical protein [Actinomadura litoris]MUN41635.1 hypothetical protein [Actinomadura litoris]